MKYLYIGAGHGDDLLYLFRSELVNDVVAPGSVEAKTIERMVDMWTHFAETGDPNAPVLRPIEWKPIAADDVVRLKGLNIAAELSISDEFPELPRLVFWNDILKE